MHYPFARAYQLSGELTKAAKKMVREKDASALDWHFATGGLSGKLEEIRKREYRGEAGNLLLRPLLLRPAASDQDGRSWEVVERIIRIFQSEKEWSEKRNKVKALREALRGGPAAVTTFRGAFGIAKLPQVVAGQTDFETTGWQGGQCGYFDAVEMADHHLHLDLVEGAA